MSWSIILVTADGLRRQVVAELQSESRALLLAREASQKDPNGIYEVREDDVLRMRLQGGEPISEPKLP